MSEQLDLKDEEAEEAAFAAVVFAEPKPTERPADKPVEKPVEAAAEPKPEAKPTEATPPAEPKPEYVQITRDEFGRFKSVADETPKLKNGLDKALGTIGNLQQIVKQLQSQAAGGIDIETIKQSKRYQKLAEDFPDLAENILGTLEDARIRHAPAHSPAAAAPEQAKPAQIDDDALQKRVLEVANEREKEALEDAHPGWSKTIGGADEETEFRKWLKTQPEDYQKRVNTTWSSAVVARALDRFEASKKAASPPPKPPAPRDTARQDRIRGAIPPKGDGAPPVPRKGNDSEDDGFRQGFAA